MSELEQQVERIKAKQNQILGGLETNNNSETTDVLEQEGSVARGVANRLTYAIAGALGTPVDIVSAMTNAGVGYTEPEGGALFSSKFNRRMIKDLGVGLPEEGSKPENVYERGIEIIGHSVLPVMKWGQLAKPVLKQSSKTKEMLLKAKEELKAKDREIASVFFATMAGDEAEKRGFGETGQAIAELLGSFAPNLSNIATTVSIGAQAVKGVAGMMGRGAAESRASKRIANQTSDVDTAKANLAEDSILELSPVTQTDDLGLMALQQAALDDDPKLLKRISDGFNDNIKTAKKLILQDGSPQYTIDYLTGIKQKAVLNAKNKIDNLGLDVDPVTASIALRGAIDDAYTGARTLETKIWGQLDEGAYTPQEDVVDTFRDILYERNVADDPADIPSFLYQLIGEQTKTGFVVGAMKTDTSLGVLKTLRSRIQQQRQVERALDVPNNKKLSLLSRINDTVLETLAEVSPEYAAAVNYSRELNKSFTSGRVGNLMGFEKTGGRTVTPEGTFSYITSGGADKARQGIRQTLSSSPEARTIMAENIKGLFNQSVMIDGALDVDKARRFMSKQAIVLEEFPELQKGINASIKQQTIVDTMMGRNMNSPVSTRIKNQSVMSLYLDHDADKAMHSLLNAPRQGADGAIMRKMVKQVQADKTGKALSGLKTAFGEYVIDFATIGDEGLSGGKMLTLLEKHNASAKELLTPIELKRFKRIGVELRRMNKAQKSKKAQDVINDFPSKIFNIIVAIAGAKGGAALADGGASIQLANIGSTTAKDFFKSLTNDDARALLIQSIEDPVLLKTLFGQISEESITKIIRKNGVAGGQMLETSREMAKDPQNQQSINEKTRERIRAKQANYNKVTEGLPQGNTVEIKGGNPDLAGTYNDQEAIEYIQNVERQGTEQ